MSSNLIARSEKREIAADQKALALPASPVALPAAPAVRVLDLLRAIDGAAIVGDLFAVRALTAAAVRQLEQAAGIEAGTSSSAGSDGEAS